MTPPNLTLRPIHSPEPSRPARPPLTPSDADRMLFLEASVTFLEARLAKALARQEAAETKLREIVRMFGVIA